MEESDDAYSPVNGDDAVVWGGDSGDDVGGGGDCDCDGYGTVTVMLMVMVLAMDGR